MDPPAAPDQDACAADDDDDADVAASPRMQQVLPISPPLHSRRAGLQEARHPKWLFRKMLEDEDADDEWRFRRDRATAALARMQQLASGLRARAAAAERDVEKAEALVADSLVDIKWAVANRERRCDISAEEYKARCREAEVRLAEVETECAQRVKDAQALFDQERAHTSAVEAVLANERRRADAAAAHVEEAAAESRRLIEARGARAEEAAAAARGRVDAARDAAEQRMRAAEARAAEALQLRRRQLEAAREAKEAAIVMEAQRRAEAAQEVERRRHLAACRVEAEVAAATRLQSRHDDDCKQHLGKVLDREQETRVACDEWNRGAVASIFETAASKSMGAHRREHLSKRSLEQTAHVLGRHFSTQRQFNSGADSRLTHILRGCLHEAEAPGFRSPRALPVPRAFGEAD